MKIRDILTIMAILAAEAYSASIEVSKPFQGICHYHRKTTVPRLLDMHLIEIDLTDPQIRFKVTSPSNPPENKVQKVSAFLAAEYTLDPAAKIAVNAAFFAYDATHAYPYCWNRGLVASMGTAYSPWQSSDSGDSMRPWPVFNISADNQPSVLDRISHPNSPYGTVPAIPLYNAVSGSERIVLNGANNAGKVTYGQPTELHPRTTIGYTNDNRLFILIVDGRQPTTHSAGMTSLETADFLISCGVTDAVNWDGGGSTTLAFAEPVRVINKPSDVPDRSVSASLCVFAGDLGYVEESKFIFADFEQGDEGTFAQTPAYSGSTRGITAASSAVTLSDGYKSGTKQRLTLIDDANVTGGWFVRHVSGPNANRSQNTPRPAKGYIGFWAKTSATGVWASIAIDNTNDVTADAGVAKELITDGLWHLYEWNLEDDDQWEGWVNGDGIIDTDDVTIDSIQFSSLIDQSIQIDVDAISHNPEGSVHKLYTRIGDIQNDGGVDLEDFMILSAAWQTAKGDPAWNPYCDIGLPRDDVIDILDLTVLVGDWTQNN